MQIIDAQVHIWPPHRPDRPLAADMRNEPAFTREDLLADMDRAGVDRAVLVPPVAYLNGNDYALEAARDYPDRLAVMGKFALRQPADPRRLATWRETPGMRGVRLGFHHLEDQPLLTDGAFDWFWPEVERHGIPVMIHAPGFGHVIRDIASRHPGLTLIYDHIGAYARPTADFGPVVAQLVPLADLPNVSVKLSALACFSTEPYPFADLREPLRRIVDAFGPRRAFWGSDLTRIPKTCSYRQTVTHVAETLDFLSAEDRAWIMGKGLAACLNWGEAR